VPGRPDAQDARDLDRVMEVAPAFGPVVGDLAGGDADQGAAADGGLKRREAGQLAVGAVEHVLDDAAVEVDLLDPRRREREELGERVGRVGAADADGEADHRPCGWTCRARRMRAKIDSSLRRLSGVIVALNRSSILR